MQMENLYNRNKLKEIHDTYDELVRIGTIISQFDQMLNGQVPLEFKIYGDSKELVSINGIDYGVALQAFNDAKEVFIKAYNARVNRLNKSLE